jgi:hypothetical protein
MRQGVAVVSASRMRIRRHQWYRRDTPQGPPDAKGRDRSEFDEATGGYILIPLGF